MSSQPDRAAFSEPRTSGRSAWSDENAPRIDDALLQALNLTLATRSRSELQSAAAALCSMLGADLFAILEVTPRPKGPDVAVSFGSVTQSWRDHYCEAGHLARDPLLRVALQRHQPLYWSDLKTEKLSLSKDEAGALAQAERLGLGDAFIAPQHRRSGRIEAVLLVGSRLEGSGATRALHAIACSCICSSKQRIDAAQGRSMEPARRLRPRQLQALYWVEQGAANKEIAAAMGISHGTVAVYLSQAGEILGVRGRRALAQAAADLGLLPLFLTGPAS